MKVKKSKLNLKFVVACLTMFIFVLTIPFVLTGCALDGEDGVDGTKWWSGQSEPQVSVGVDGDYYLNTEKYILYKKVDSSWFAIMNNFGKPGTSLSANEVELRVNEDEIQWRYKTGTDTSWKNLISISEIKGDPGSTPQIIDGYWWINGSNTGIKAVGESSSAKEIELQVTDTQIQWRYVGDDSWNNLVDLSALKGSQGDPGQPGKEVEIANNNGKIQWRYVGEGNQWQTIIDAETLKGSSGSDGTTPSIGNNGNWWIGDVDTQVKAEGVDGRNIQLQVSGSKIQYQYQGDESWIDLFDTSILKGEDGATWSCGVKDLATMNSENVGKTGDFYMNTTTYDIYQKSESAWILVGNIKGQDADESRIEKIEDELNNGKIDVTRLSNYQNYVVYDKENLVPEDSVWHYNAYINATNGDLNLNGYNNTYIAIETYLPVEGESSYVLFGNKTALNIIHYAYYDDGMAYISGAKNQTLIFTTPENAKYVRFSIYVREVGADVSIEDITTGVYTIELYKQSTTVYSEPKIVAEVCGLDADTTIVNGSINPEKTSFFTKYESPNLLRNYTSGYYMGTTSTIANVNSTYCIFETIPVVPGNIVNVYSSGKEVLMRFVTAYNEKGELISKTATTEENAYTYSYLVPENCYFVTITINQESYKEGETKLQIQCTKDGLYLGKYYEPGVSLYYLNEEYYKAYEYEAPLHVYMPSEICVADNTTIELYYSQICLEYEDYNFQWIADFGRAFEWKFQIKGNTQLNGQTKTLTLNLYDDDLNRKYTQTCKVKFVSSTIELEQLIIPIGDSLTNSKAWLQEVNNLSGGKISFRGTQGVKDKTNTTTMSHEGRSGATPDWYNKDSQYTYNPTNTTLEVLKTASGSDYTLNPFWNPTTNQFDFDYYCNSTAEGGAGYFQDSEGNEISIVPTGVQIYLGTNGIKLDSTNAVSAIQQLIENIQKSEKGKNIPIYVVNTLFRPTQIYSTNNDGFSTNSSGEFSFQANMKVMNLEIALYSALSSNSHVVFVPVATTHDSEHNFPYTMENINPRNDSEQYKVYTDTVHPTTAGYNQMADIMFATIACHYKDFVE